MTTTSIDRHVPASGTGKAPEMRAGAATPGSTTERPETELRAAARRRGLTMKELAAQMGVSSSYLSQIATGASRGRQRCGRRPRRCWERSPDRGSSTGRAA